MNRGQTLKSILVLAILLAGSLLVYRAVTGTGQGIGLFHVPVDERVSSRFVTKSVTERVSPLAGYGSTGLEEGSANLVTSIVVNYRAFDTLLEVIVLFAATTGVALLTVRRDRSRYREASVIVRTAVPIINLVVFTAGAVIVLRGHLSPGGGFAGGAVIASGFILLSLAFRRIIRGTLFVVLESLMGLFILGVGFAGLYLEGSFLQNFLPTGEVGAFMSAGIVPILYVLIGVKVLSEISNISFAFLGSGEGI